MKLEELDYDYTVHEDRYKQDGRLMVRFFKELIIDEQASKDAGYKKFREAVFVQIVVPGDRRHIVVREAREDDINRFRDKYDRFMANEQVQIDGYPLSQWPQVARAQVEELKYLNFHTVEHLANASEQAMAKYPGLRELSRRACVFITAQKENAPVEKLQSQIDEMAAVNKQLQEQLRSLLETAGRDPKMAVAAAGIVQAQVADPADLGED